MYFVFGEECVCATKATQTVAFALSVTFMDECQCWHVEKSMMCYIAFAGGSLNNLPSYFYFSSSCGFVASSYLLWDLFGQRQSVRQSLKVFVEHKSMRVGNPDKLLHKRRMVYRQLWGKYIFWLNCVTVPSGTELTCLLTDLSFPL